MISVDDAKLSIETNCFMSEELKKYLIDLVRKENQRRQPVREGDVVSIAGKVFVIAKIFDFTDYRQVVQDNMELLAVLYNPIRKTLGFAWESLYTDPDSCKIISHIDPKQIFREDIKV